MADWFKVYETDLDDELLQWAMTIQPCTAIVYFAILSKCCKEKSGSFKWSKDHELFALAQKVHAGVGHVNQAVSLLCRIEFISLNDGNLTVTKWPQLQSEYCQRKSKVSGQCRDKVELCRPRGEEKREENFSREDRLPVRIPKHLKQERKSDYGAGTENP